MTDESQGLEDWEAWMDKTIEASLHCMRTHHDLVVEHTQSLRSGHNCVIHYPTDETGYKSGNMSLHLIVEWDDGKEWMLRIKHDAERSRQASRRLMMESEVAAMSFMAYHGLPVPDAWASPPLPMPEADTVHMWCLMERMPGRPFSPWHFPHPESQRNLTGDLADFYIRLAALPLKGVGALCLDPSGERGKVVIGPSDLYLPLRDDLPTEPPTATLLGPWSTSAEYHTARIDEIIRQLHPELLSSCLLFLEARQMIQHDHELSHPQPTYICHGDPNGGHLLANPDGHLSAIIDWEFCVTRTFEEAFQAPLGFIPIPDLEAGQIALSPIEQMLADALRKKGRTDLAECVDKGRKWHILRLAPGHPDDLNLTNTFRRLWMGEDARQFETVEKWKIWALEEFKDAPELQRFL